MAAEAKDTAGQIQYYTRAMPARRIRDASPPSDTALSHIWPPVCSTARRPSLSCFRPPGTSETHSVTGTRLGALARTGRYGCITPHQRGSLRVYATAHSRLVRTAFPSLGSRPSPRRGMKSLCWTRNLAGSGNGLLGASEFVRSRPGTSPWPGFRARRQKSHECRRTLPRP